ncbi:hypothetical protein AK88_04277 [Plasmodium fragile]|uniref:Schizont-infected cell agglutination C-terminal domain-containing protein n=1 Tax=Plasmodium fragile TaxID=5857 RepID=A0A0D9QK54_PLAFR|nr:uncharacterized protein AK88_04277 [Plasmodium fragile]KJP86086.1 hypothetical protein AK88_04277 [Plasmodium fragile]
MYLQKNFWEHVNTVWQTFKQHMEDENEDTMIDLMCHKNQAPAGNAQAQGETFSETNKAVCWLVLKALSFKYGIKWMRGGKNLNNVEKKNDNIKLYMKCILVNIFMKKIVGQKCLEAAGGRQAFTAATALLRDRAKEEPNMACETQDRKDGSMQKSQNTENWDPWEIMHRWLERNKGYLTDGEQGVLGTECIVQKDKTAQEIKKAANNKIEDVGQELQHEVKQILEELNKSRDSESMENIIKKVKQGKDSASNTPPPHAQPPGEPQATSSSTSSTPGRSEHAHAGNGGGAVATNAPATPAPDKPPGKGGQEVAAKPVATKPPELQDCQGDRLLEWRQKETYVQANYGKQDMDKLQKVLKDFKEYMGKNEQHVDAYGVNCYNSGWEDMDNTSTFYTQQMVPDVVRCRLMTIALGFANGWGRQDNATQDGVHMSEEEENSLRCEVVNVFGHLLKKKYCERQQQWYRGIEYAYIVMQNMGDEKLGTGLPPGPVTDKRCTMWGYEGHRRNVEAINLPVVEWLLQDTQLLGKIAQMQREMPCNTEWKQYIQEQGLKNNITEHRQAERTQIEDKVGKKVKTNAAEIIQRATEVVEEKITELNDRNTSEKATSTTADAPTPGANVARKDSEDDEPPARPPRPPKPQNGNDQGAPGQGAAGSGGPGPVPQPPPPAPPRAEGTGGNPGSNKPQEGELDCENEDSSGVPSGTETHTGSSVSVSKARHAMPGQLPCSELKTLLRPQHITTSPPAVIGGGSPEPRPAGNTESTDTESKNGTEAGSAQPTPGAPPAAPSPAVPTGEPTPQSTGTETTSTANAGDGSTRDTQDAVIDKGNDDPPPLNPPKPKPETTHPNQSGSTVPGAGAPSSGGGADGVSGREGQGGAGDGGGGAGAAGAGAGSTGPVKPNSSGTDSTGHGTATTGGGRAAPTPANPSVPPGLTWEDVKPYTPAIIPAVVGIGVLAFFLWKYFAYLAKRRRKFRTVRDVPSPPLDEEILAHLQRGELPPPDYGYTMIRDTKPASAAERRGQRPPRVHKRTIIELHLEVLNECEATEWENVKDDYLQIVVEEFAQHLMRDGKGYSSSLDAPITNQDLSGNNVASTLDPPTDTAVTDACPLNDPDTWSCMETIQLATDPWRPNAQDPDPWSCMESIQLDTDRAPPNEDDRCCCMETIQLATDRSPPNEDNPWRCMESIQFEPEQRPATSPGHVTSECTQWINWIDRNKHLLRACTGQTWFLQLKADWKQYLRAHMVANEDNGVHGQREFGDAATLPMQKVRLWKEWVAQQHRHVSTYSEEEWFQHLLENIEEATASHKGEVPIVENDLEVEKVMAAAYMLRVRDAPEFQQLHPQSYMKKRLTAQTWILILALVLAQCELESSMQQRELYVDALLQNMRH